MVLVAPGCFSSAGQRPDDAGPADAGPIVAAPAELTPVPPTEDFYVQSYSATPSVDGAAWRLTLDGALTQPVTLSLADLHELGAREKEHTLVCIGASDRYKAIGNARWEGRPLQEILEAHGSAPLAEAVELQFTSADSYETSIPFGDWDDRDLWLVWRMNGEPLNPAHGYPARLLIPGRYGIKNPKWLERISFATEARQGYWESRGWSNDATYRPTTFFHFPQDGPQGTPDQLSLLGSAYCGQVPIEAVEVSADGGSSWEAATITYGGQPDVWTLWRYDFTPPGAGSYALLARIRCEDGQVTDPDWSNDLGGYAGYGKLTVEIG